MSEANVLIVGAGALGLTTAYHLQLAGAQISFLVRPHRLEALSRPQRLYSYGDRDLKQLASYQLFTSPGDLKNRFFDFVLLTLDGATCCSDQGVAMLSELGSALVDTRATLIINGVGVGLYDHVRTTTGLSRENLLQGTMKSFAYQVGQEGTPLPPAADLEMHNSADIAFLKFSDGASFFVTSRPVRRSKAFSKLYNKSGVASCARMPALVYEMSTNMFFPFILASELNAWQGTENLIADRELWHQSCCAQREIMRLKPYGLIGKLVGRIMTDARLAKMMLRSDREASAMGFTAFNRFHHGRKVLQQNVQILENCIALGKEEGSDMEATESLLRRWRESRC